MNLDNLNEITPAKWKRYEIDFDKIKTLEDLIEIIKALDISFGEKYPKFNSIKHLLKEVKE